MTLTREKLIDFLADYPELCPAAIEDGLPNAGEEGCRLAEEGSADMRAVCHACWEAAYPADGAARRAEG